MPTPVSILKPAEAIREVRPPPSRQLKTTKMGTEGFVPGQNAEHWPCFLFAVLPPPVMDVLLWQVK